MVYAEASLAQTETTNAFARLFEAEGIPCLPVNLLRFDEDNESVPGRYLAARRSDDEDVKRPYVHSSAISGIDIP